MTQRTLILNATFEPLCVVPLKRAIILLMTDKAEMIEEAVGSSVNSAKIHMAAPAVIKLNRYVKIPYRKRAPLTRRSVLVRDDHRCCYCKVRKATTMDHIKPRAHGGRHEWMNVVASCAKCNFTKADRTPAQAGMEMMFTPTLPEGVAALRVVMGVIDPAWESYLVSA